MAEERKLNDEWLDEISERLRTRSYRPISGPDDPPDPPAGRGSASLPDDHAGHQEAPTQPEVPSKPDKAAQ